MTITNFDLAGGSIVGLSHARAGRNNQDAFSWRFGAGGVVAVVTDGCGSAPHSEVGAQLGARLFTQAAVRQLGRSPEEILHIATEEMLAHLRGLLSGMSTSPAMESFAQAVHDHFLFSLVGFVLDGTMATTFSFGDGLVGVNGNCLEIGPFPGNQPPYLGYALLSARSSKQITIHHRIDLRELSSLWVGTDGTRPLAGPGLPSDLSLADERLFRNPDMVRRRLTMHQREKHDLTDDTTLVVLRRKPERE